MENSQEKVKLQESKSPRKRAICEADLVEELQRLVAGVPAGSAVLHQLPENPEWLCRYYEVKPANDKAARLIVGVVLNDLHLTVGEVECELIGFGRGGAIVPGGSWLDDLRWIWQVVIKGGFSQQQYLDRDGNVIGGASALRLEGISYDFRCGRVAKTLFGERKCRNVLYDQYY